MSERASERVPSVCQSQTRSAVKFGREASLNGYKDLRGTISRLHLNKMRRKDCRSGISTPQVPDILTMELNSKYLVKKVRDERARGKSDLYQRQEVPRRAPLARERENTGTGWPLVGSTVTCTGTALTLALLTIAQVRVSTEYVRTEWRNCSHHRTS